MPPYCSFGMLRTWQHMPAQSTLHSEFGFWPPAGRTQKRKPDSMTWNFSHFVHFVPTHWASSGYVVRNVQKLSQCSPFLHQDTEPKTSHSSCGSTWTSEHCAFKLALPSCTDSNLGQLRNECLFLNVFCKTLAETSNWTISFNLLGNSHIAHSIQVWVCTFQPCGKSCRSAWNRCQPEPPNF